MLYAVALYVIIRYEAYGQKSKDPTHFVQLGIRNGKKTTTKNVARIGKHSELLKITDDPLAYAKEQVKKYNEEYKKDNKVSWILIPNLVHENKFLGKTCISSETRPYYSPFHDLLYCSSHLSYSWEEAEPEWDAFYNR